MTKLDISISELILAALAAIALIFCFTTFNGASAETMAKNKYQVLKKNIMAEYKTAKIRCMPLISSEKMFCDMNAIIAKNQSMSDLDSSFTPLIQQRKIAKSDKMIQDKTVEFDDFNDKSNPFNTLEFNNIYHVKA